MHGNVLPPHPLRYAGKGIGSRDAFCEAEAVDRDIEECIAEIQRLKALSLLGQGVEYANSVSKHGGGAAQAHPEPLYDEI